MIPQTIFLKPDEMIFREGDKGGSLYHIKKGEVVIFRERNGTEIILETMVAGEFIGTATVLSSLPRTAGAKARGDAELDFYSAQMVSEAVTGLPLWMKAILKDVINRLKRLGGIYVESKLAEKKLLMELPTVFLQATQFSYMLDCSMKRVAFKHNNAASLAMNDIFVHAESVLRVRSESLESLLACMVDGGVGGLAVDNNKGRIFTPADDSVLEDFGFFMMRLHLNGPGWFIPQELLQWVDALSAFPSGESAAFGITWQEISSFFIDTVGEKPPEKLADKLIQFDIIQPAKARLDGYSFSPEKIKRRFMFEKIGHAIAGLKLQIMDRAQVDG